MRRKARDGAILILIAGIILFGKLANASAANTGELVTAEVTAVLTADGHFSEGGSRADDTLKLVYKETSVFRFSVDDRERVSFQYSVIANGKGKLVLGQDLPTPTWTFFADEKKDTSPHADVFLGSDRTEGLLTLRDFMSYVTLNCDLPNDGLTASFPIATHIASQTLSDYAYKHTPGDLVPEIRIPVIFPPGSNIRKVSGELKHRFTESQGLVGTGDLTVTYTITRVPPAFSQEKSDDLESIPFVTAEVQRGETLLLDGSQSKGNITEYQWTLTPRAGGGADSSVPAKTTKHGANSQVIVLDGLDVELMVTDGHKQSTKSISVKIVPRSYFRTYFEHVSQEGMLPDSTCPKCVWTGTDSNGNKTFYGEWEGGENVCAIDPPEAGNSEPPHIFHPDPEKAEKDTLYTLEEVKDPQGPWDGFFYFSEWKVEVRRQTRLNRYIQEDGPPFPGMKQNFYQGNLARHQDAVGYLAAVRKHEYQHTLLMTQALDEIDPAKKIEKSWGKDRQKLQEDANKQIRDAGKLLHERAKDPLEEIWKGNLAVPQTGTLDWRIFEVKVGGAGYGGF